MRKNSNREKVVFQRVPVGVREQIISDEWTFEGSLKSRVRLVRVGADGIPPVIHPGMYVST